MPDDKPFDFKAVMAAKEKEIALTALRQLTSKDFINGIPSAEILNDLRRENMGRGSLDLYKCGPLFFQRAKETVSRLLSLGLVTDPEAKTKAEDFIKLADGLKEGKFKQSEVGSQEEVEQADEILILLKERFVK